MIAAASTSSASTQPSLKQRHNSTSLAVSLVGKVETDPLFDCVAGDVSEGSAAAVGVGAETDHGVGDTAQSCTATIPAACCTT